MVERHPRIAATCIDCACVDDPGHEESGHREARCHLSTRSATPTSGATTRARDRAATDFVGNVARADRVRARAASSARSASRVDRTEWTMTPPTVNAYYNPAAQRDRTSRPASCSRRSSTGSVDDAVNYGAIGVGHRPRDDARLRRPGPPVRRQGQPPRLVDARRRQGLRGAGPVHRGPVHPRRARAGGEDQREADPGRGHRRQRRDSPRARRPRPRAGQGGHQPQHQGARTGSPPASASSPGTPSPGARTSDPSSRG